MTSALSRSCRMESVFHRPGSRSFTAETFRARSSANRAVRHSNSCSVRPSYRRGYWRTVSSRSSPVGKIGQAAQHSGERQRLLLRLVALGKVYRKRRDRGPRFVRQRLDGGVNVLEAVRHPFLCPPRQCHSTGHAPACGYRKAAQLTAGTFLIPIG
jgi:hypothetical protein